MPSFDVVSEVDVQEVRNAVDQATRELGTRFDFRGVDASFEFGEDNIQIAAEEEFQLRQMLDILHDKLNRRGVDAKALDMLQATNTGHCLGVARPAVAEVADVRPVRQSAASSRLGSSRRDRAARDRCGSTLVLLTW